MQSIRMRALGVAALLLACSCSETPGRPDARIGDRPGALEAGPDRAPADGLADRPLADRSKADKPLAPPIPGGKWTRLDPGGTGPWGAYFYRSVALADGRIWMGWGSPADGPNRGNFLFDGATNTWTRTNAVVNDPAKNIGARENYGAWYDGDRDCVWIGDGAPVAYGFPNGPQSGDLKYDIATDTFSLAYPNYGSNPTSVGIGDGALAYHGNTLYAFGGWSVGAGQSLRKLDLLTAQKSSLAGGSTPSFTQDPARLTYARSGVDSQGVLWTLADDGELYQLDVKISAPTWSHVPTTGQKPGKHNFGAALHQIANLIVAYLGKDGMVGADNGAPVGDTYLLDLGSKQWRFGPRQQQGDLVPTVRELSVSVMNYDPHNKRIVMTISVGTGCEVWAYVPPAP